MRSSQGTSARSNSGAVQRRPMNKDDDDDKDDDELR